MPISEINILNIRGYINTGLKPHPRANIISGDNASGKTTLLEAISLLTSSKSFRTNCLDQICRQGCGSFRVNADYLSLDGKQLTNIAVAFDGRRRTYQVAGNSNARTRELAAVLPSIVISPESHHQFLSTPKERRSSIDWVLFHVKPSFIDIWTRFRRTLEQRTHALRNKRTKQYLPIWDAEYLTVASSLSDIRVQTTTELLPLFQAYAHSLLGIESEFTLGYSKGWDESSTLETELIKNAERDFVRGVTHCGPHRGDLHILVDGRHAKTVASHGQLKLLVLAIKLAQIDLVSKKSHKECCLLIDDISAELDEKHRDRAFSLVAELPTQTFITTTNAGDISKGIWPDLSTFHVEHGQINDNSFSKQYFNC